MSDVTSILLAGVGGQGIVLSGRILSEGLLSAGYDVKMSEVHGMAQRGGSVTTQIRYGEKVFSPIIGKAGADIIMAMEKMEAVRWLPYLKKDGVVIVNDFEIPSAPILQGKASYPCGIIDELKKGFRVIPVEAARIAGELGNPRVMNVVMIGSLVRALGLSQIDWKGIIAGLVKPKYADMNVKAFTLGYESADFAL